MNKYIFLLLLAVVIILTKKYRSAPTEARVGQYETTHFIQSDGKSMEVFENLRLANASDETRLRFITMEDQFLAYEKEIVCMNRPGLLLQAIQLSEQIKDAVPAQDFAYHTRIIKQMSEPSKMVNRRLAC